MNVNVLVCLMTVLSSAYALSVEQVPVVQVEKLELSEMADEFTYPARVTSRVQGAVTSDIDGVIVKVVAGLGQKVGRGATLFMVKNTDPVYEYVPVSVASPVSGVVSLIEVSEGSIVRKGQKLGSVVDPTQVLIETEIPASDLSFFKKGLKGRFIFSETQQDEIVVQGVSPLVDPMTGTASAQLKPLSNNIPLGVIGRVVFRTNIRKSIQVAEQAVVMRGLETLLRVVDDSKAKWVPVKITSTKKGISEVASGISPGTTVIISSSKYVGDGQAVSIQQPDVAKK